MPEIGQHFFFFFLFLGANGTINCTMFYSMQITHSLSASKFFNCAQVYVSITVICNISVLFTQIFRLDR